MVLLCFFPPIATRTVFCLLLERDLDLDRDLDRDLDLDRDWDRDLERDLERDRFGTRAGFSRIFSIRSRIGFRFLCM